MLRKVIRRGFCVNHNDPIHARNYQNNHHKAFMQKFHETPENEILGNFQKRFHDAQYIEQSEVSYSLIKIETRILKILYDSELVKRLDKFSFNQDLRKQLNLDSLNITVLLTSIEHEFTTVFEDKVFESVRNLSEVVTLLARDPKIF